LHFAALLIPGIDAGEAITVLTGVHVGCFELFTNEQIRAIRDLKGKKVGIQGAGVYQHAFIAAMAAHVGLDPAKDIEWVLSPTPRRWSCLQKARSMHSSAFHPSHRNCAPARSRATGTLFANIRSPPSVRCARFSRQLIFARPIRRLPHGEMVDRGFTTHYEYALQMLNEVPYNKWRQYDPADTIRFYSLRLHEAGTIKSTPNKIVAEATDWRFLNELKRELKG
jgi:NitT/TauT family transport system substrate-binding protein